MTANDKQVGGDHYKGKVQHWDWSESEGLDYFQGSITKYVARWKKKNGIEDLKKALHYLEKYIELNEDDSEQRGVCLGCGKTGALEKIEDDLMRCESCRVGHNRYAVNSEDFRKLYGSAAEKPTPMGLKYGGIGVCSGCERTSQHLLRKMLNISSRVGQWRSFDRTRMCRDCWTKDPEFKEDADEWRR